MKENQRIGAAIDLRVRQLKLNLPNLPLPGDRASTRQYCSAALERHFRPKWITGLLSNPTDRPL